MNRGNYSKLRLAPEIMAHHPRWLLPASPRPTQGFFNLCTFGMGYDQYDTRRTYYEYDTVILFTDTNEVPPIHT